MHAVVDQLYRAVLHLLTISKHLQEIIDDLIFYLFTLVLLPCKRILKSFYVASQIFSFLKSVEKVQQEDLDSSSGPSPAAADGAGVGAALLECDALLGSWKLLPVS